MDKSSGRVLLIRTKLYPPSLPEDYVVRSRLTAALDQGRHTPLTIVSAPAGYGKSVLASEWVGTLDRRPAWLSLDNSDSDPQLFVSYLCAAIDDMMPDAMASVRDLLDAAEPVPTPVMAGSLMNDLDRIGEPVFIVLDDFHRLETDSAVTELLSFLLEHPPPNMHLFILTRRDPPLALGRLRAGNRLVEVRLRDLRFDCDETAQLMRTAVGAPLGESSIRHLDNELEGWPVGLRLVALMLSRARDPEAAVAGLHGGIPQSQDYMLREVLAGLPPETRSCLLKTSILGRLTADLVQAVCQEDGSSQSGMDGGAFLRELRKANLFAYSLDSQERWYRYHHWFKQVLEMQLEARFEPAVVRELHLRAGYWLEVNGEPGDALTHFLAAEEPDLAAELVAGKTMDLIEQDQWFVVDRWLQTLLDVVREAAPSGWVRPFIEPGDPVEELLGRIDPGGSESAFVEHLRAGFEARRVAEHSRETCATRRETARRLPAPSPSVDAGVEDLTDREMDILEFLAQRLQNKEIAARLFISPHTVGYHLKHIYEKLGVHGRRQAVRKARSAGILSAR